MNADFPASPPPSDDPTIGPLVGPLAGASPRDWPDLPLPEPQPPAQPASPEPPHDPVWSGFEVGVVILFTALGILAVTLIAWLTWAIVAHSLRLPVQTEFGLVLLTLIGQTGGMALGLTLARHWIENVHGAQFWQAIHWRKLSAPAAAAVLLAGMATIVAVNALAHVLPMPPQVPMDRLFTPQTAWLLLIYGVAIAPFFEEFYFRGLIYPSLRSSFAEGMSPKELREWRPLIRTVSLLALLLTLWLWLRTSVLGLTGRGGVAALEVTATVLLAWLIAPGLLLGPVGWAINLLARWGRAELLAILVTGFLFGMLHAAQLGWSWAAVLILVLVGMVLTWVRAATGSLMASWLFHCAYNGTLFAVQLAATQGFRHFPPGH